MSGQVPDPGQVHTIPELIAALQVLRAGRSYEQLNAATRQSPRDEGTLPKSTVSDLLREGRPSVETLEVFLRACQVPRGQWQAWQQARERALSSTDTDVPGLVRVAAARPRHLGVHAAIEVPGATGELPAYVERDTDTAPGGVRQVIGAAAESGQGALVVLVCDSSSGKTRYAVEAIRALVPTWWLLHPDPDDLGRLRGIAADPPGRLVVWLDELQRYLGGPEGLRAGTVRALLEAGAVLVATLWSERHRAYTAVPHDGSPDSHTAERELLRLAKVIIIGEDFSPAERRRAEQAARAGDARRSGRSPAVPLTHLPPAATSSVSACSARWRSSSRDPAARRSGPRRTPAHARSVLVIGDRPNGSPSVRTVTDDQVWPDNQAITSSCPLGPRPVMDSRVGMSRTTMRR
ncbi:hypothetical protein [Sphaerisporangium sp. NPDC051011]|uniref:hypothetical protein n=1 Tax=Sphaerisporangium sp. NPDC051011 TaxID=3155792 RepID=UPI0033DB637A